MACYSLRARTRIRSPPPPPPLPRAHTPLHPCLQLVHLKLQGIVGSGHTVQPVSEDTAVARASESESLTDASLMSSMPLNSKVSCAQQAVVPPIQVVHDSEIHSRVTATGMRSSSEQPSPSNGSASGSDSARDSESPPQPASAPGTGRETQSGVAQVSRYTSSS
jgi:hypothetical protein